MARRVIEAPVTAIISAKTKIAVPSACRRREARAREPRKPYHARGYGVYSSTQAPRSRQPHLRNRRAHANATEYGYFQESTTFAGFIRQNSTKTSHIRSAAASCRCCSAKTRRGRAATCAPPGENLFEAFARGATEAGADVVDIGMVSTDALYFAVGKYGFDGGVMITASHNPAQYNGMKFTREQAQAMSLDTGLADDSRSHRCRATLPPKAAKPGTIAQRRHSRRLRASTASRSSTRRRSSRSRSRSMPGNGMAGETVPHVFKHLAVRSGAALLRTRRQLPESSRKPDRAREHGRPASRGPQARLRSGRRVRRRCRPHVHRR